MRSKFKNGAALWLAALAGVLNVSACATTQVPIAATPAPSAIAATPAQSNIDAVTQILQKGVDKQIAAGLAVALTDASGRTQTTFVGMADRAANRPIDADTVYRLYSMTKPVTAVAIMILVEDGKIDLDVPLQTYLPAFANARVFVSGDSLTNIQTAPLARPLTVRDLMRQSSGMPYIGQEKPVEKLFFAAGIERAPGEVVPGVTGRRVSNLQELSDRIAATPLSTQPGDLYTYGSAIDVLGRVVEVASGQTLGAFFQARIFAPLGMSHTAFSVKEADSGRLANVYFSRSPSPITSTFLNRVPLDTVATGTLTMADSGQTSIFTQPARLEFGGSGLVGTLDDYVRFAAMIANSGELNGQRILKASSVAQMGSDQLTPAASERLRTTGRTYGLGFGIIVDPTLSGSNAPVGTMFWAGAAGTIFWANRETRQSGVLMTQMFGDNLSIVTGAAIRAAHGVRE